MKYELKITLKSDLCSASGDGFSLSIDTDVCYDSHGFPTIPSRRLKGCMLDAAKYIGAGFIEELFGVGGNEKSGNLRIGNAVLENYNSLKSQAANCGRNAQQILSLFTSVRASTAIENDTAKPESLRFMRVVNHYSPFNKTSELTFAAPVEADEKYFPELSKICRAVRNIGYKRSRGFGAVRCQLLEANSGGGLKINGEISDNEKDYELRFSVLTNSPIMLPGKNSDETEDFIPGTSIMGFFAKKYLENHAADNAFEDMFLKDNVIFSNMYIVSENGAAAVPAPSAIAKDKTEDKPNYVNILVGEKDTERILKPLKSGYFAGGSEVKVKTETLYHHSEGKDSTLYTQTCLSAEQIFGGTISGKGKYLREIIKILGEGKISVGRSKSAQYAECSVIFADVREAAEDFSEFAAGELIAAVFCADALFIDDCGNYTTEFPEVCAKLGIDSAIPEKSFMKYKTVTGYMSAGRYKKPHIRGVGAGSTICFKSENALKLPKVGHFGEKTGEGFGAVRFVKAAEIMSLGDAGFSVDKDRGCDGELRVLLAENENREKMRAKAINYAKKNRKDLCGLTSSFIGRVSLMIRQAEDYDDFLNRIDSIKTESKRIAAEKIAKTAEQFGEWQTQREYLEIIFLLGKYFLRTENKISDPISDKEAK